MSIILATLRDLARTLACREEQLDIVKDDRSARAAFSRRGLFQAAGAVAAGSLFSFDAVPSIVELWRYLTLSLGTVEPDGRYTEYSSTRLMRSSEVFSVQGNRVNVLSPVAFSQATAHVGLITHFSADVGNGRIVGTVTPPILLAGGITPVLARINDLEIKL